MYPGFNFSFTPHSKGRLGALTTPHGTIKTPAFIFCATKGTVKSLMPSHLKASGCQVILSNTYHMMIHPGSERVYKLGGLQKITGWNGPILTDSGGFQIFSLGHGSVATEIKGKRYKGFSSLLEVREEGALFKSYKDGTQHLLTPEKSIDIQRHLGADLILVLDECTPFHVEKTYTQRSMALSHRWAERSLKRFISTQSLPHTPQALYGVVQGGVYPDLRKESATFINASPFFGHAIGGSLGATKSQMEDVIATTRAHLSSDRPVHLLGIGGIRDIFHGVAQGIDTFDCVHPTRLARHGSVLVPPHVWKGVGAIKEHINLFNQCFAEDNDPIDPTCPCETCKTYTRGVLHCFLKAGETTALTALTLHNVTFMNRLFAAIRAALAQDKLDTIKKEWI